MSLVVFHGQLAEYCKVLGDRRNLKVCVSLLTGENNIDTLVECSGLSYFDCRATVHRLKAIGLVDHTRYQLVGKTRIWLGDPQFTKFVKAVALTDFPE